MSLRQRRDGEWASLLLLLLLLLLLFELELLGLLQFPREGIVERLGRGGWTGKDQTGPETRTRGRLLLLLLLLLRMPLEAKRLGLKAERGMVLGSGRGRERGSGLLLLLLRRRKGGLGAEGTLERAVRGDVALGRRGKGTRGGL